MFCHSALPVLTDKVRCFAGINLSSNQLRLVPACIPRVQGLKVLDLSHNLLHCLPAEIGQLIKCERLYVNNNRSAHQPKSTLDSFVPALY